MLVFKSQERRNRFQPIGRHRKDLSQHLSLGETSRFYVDVGCCDAGFDQIIRILTVDDGKVRPVAK